MRILFGTILLAAIGAQVVFAQNSEINRRAETYMMRQITEQLVPELSDLPVNIRRMAIYKINYNANTFSNESIAYIKGEIENTFRENSPVSVISPPELDPTDKLKIIGSDSTLQVMNIKGRSLADMSPELLDGVANKYSVSGLAELTIQKRQTEGLVVIIRIISPQSREIVWSQSIAAFPVREKEKVDIGKRVVIHFGATALQNASFTTATAPDSNIPVNTTTLNYNLALKYRQPLNEDNSGYLGIYTGANVLRSTESTEFETNFWEIGISFDQAITSKTEAINDYRLMLGADAAIWIAQGDKQGNLITFNPSLIFNLTENLGFEVNGLIFMTERSVQDTGFGANTYTFGQYGYGVKAYVQF